MASRIKKGDKVKIISGSLKGSTATVQAVLVKKGAALLEGVGVSTRQMKPTRLNPVGGTKNVHVPIALSKLAPAADKKAAAAKPVKNTKKTKETK